MLALVLGVPIAMHLAIDTQPRHPAVGIDMKADMGPDAIVGHRPEVMSIAGEIGGGKDLRPSGGRIGVAVAAAGLERSGRRIVSGEMAGIDVHAFDHAGAAESQGAMVVARPTPAPALPSIHPLAVVVVFAGNEDGGRRIDHPLLGREEFVGGMDRHGAEARLGEIDPEAREVGEVLGSCGHDGIASWG